MFCRLVLVLAFATVVYNKPILDSDTGSTECSQIGCPANTVACATTSKLSEDKKDLVSKTQCFGVTGDILHNITSTVKNPFGPDVFYQGFKYSGTYGLSHKGTISTTSTTSDTRRYHHKVPPFKETAQEVDDLNSDVEVQ